MKKTTIAILGGASMLSLLAAGYFFSAGNKNLGIVFGAAAVLLLWFLISRMRADLKKAAQIARAFDHPAVNLAFYGELSRLIDEGRDISPYLRECSAPQNIVKSVNIGGATAWYYHKDGLAYNEFAADFPRDQVPEVKHPYLIAQRTEALSASKETLILTLDLYRVLWDWGEAHPEKRRYANSMRIAFHGAYTPDEKTGGNTYLDKSIEDVRAARKANKKKPKKKRKPTDPQ